MSIVRVMEETLREPVFGFIGIGFTERKKSLGKRIKRILSNKYRIATKLTATSIMILFIIAVTGTFLSCSRSSSAQARKIKPEAIVQEEIEVEHTPMKEIPIYIASGWGKHLKPPDNLKRAIINLAEAVNKQTDFNVKVDTHLFLDQQKKFFETPFVYIMADEAFELTDIEKRSFGHYLRNGGFAVIDNAAPQYEFGEAEASLRQMLRDALGSEAKFLPIDKDHSLYHCHFDFDYGPPQGANLEAIIEGMTKEKKKFVRQIPFTNPLSPLEGIWIGNRLVAIYSDKGYCYRWAETGKNQPQLKFGVNMVVYALLQESGILNKKESELRSGSQSQERTKKLKVRSKSVIKIGEAGNIEESSDRVQLDGKLLIRGTDYRINYQTNEITLLNEKALSPSADLVVRYEEKENIIDK
ncbi:MAG: DUF4159 domain-containing protein [Candidatus Latescibacteria bacterium]|nr:DUF4159 domain-containing protein [Candidatus Latescibacterota bacterium]